MNNLSQDSAQKAPKDPPKRAKPGKPTKRPAAFTRYKKGRRVRQFCEDTGISKPTAYRWARAGTLLIEYAGDTPYITGGTSCLDVAA
jgi:hypothetical protein